MTEMVERVAAALARLPVRDNQALGGELDQLRLREAARAAIEAMREPTEDIVKAHHLVPEDNDFDERAADNWRALIDAALGKVDA